MRAAANGLLDTSLGCPLTIVYLLREKFIIDELARQDIVLRHGLLAQVESAAGQLYLKMPGATVQADLFETARLETNRHLLAIDQQLQPWNRNEIAKRMAITDATIKDRQTKLGDTGLTRGALVNMVREYHELKQRRADSAATK